MVPHTQPVQHHAAPAGSTAAARRRRPTRSPLLSPKLWRPCLAWKNLSQPLLQTWEALAEASRADSRMASRKRIAGTGGREGGRAAAAGDVC